LPVAKRWYAGRSRSTSAWPPSAASRHRQLAEQQVRLDGQHRRPRRPRGCRLPEAVHARCGLGQLTKRESRAGYTFERSAHCPVLEEAEKGQKFYGRTCWQD
jgi:hypothetical protein